MFDINTILTQALAAAVAEATKPLVERINVVAQHNLALEARIEALEAQLAAQATPAPQIDEAKMVEALNSQEWFWEKVSRYITNNSDITVDELHNIKQRLVELEAHEDNVYHFDKGAVTFLIAEAIESHEENRTHGDKDDIEEMVQKLLNGASISISV